MSVSAKSAVAEAGDSPVVEGGARLGYAANGVLHLLLAYLTVQVALGGGGNDEQASQSGALATLAEEPVGQVLLWVMVVGFALLAVLKITELVTRPKASDKAKAAAKTVLYGALAWTTFTFAKGGRTSSNEKTQDFTATVMDAPAGQVLVGLIGVVIIGIGCYHLYKGWNEKFLDDLQEHPGRWAVVAGKIGYIGKGIALAAVGILFATAAIQHRASKSTGLDGALRSLRDLPAGEVVLIGIAIGLAAYGIYSFARARNAQV